VVTLGTKQGTVKVLAAGLAQEPTHYALIPPLNMLRADVYVWSPVAAPKAVLVLSPGMNGNGQAMIQQRAWQQFARKNRLGLVGLSFASDMELLLNGKGYYYVAQGSGELLLHGIEKIFGKANLPLLMYGFSGGAHFTSRFEEWKPERVLTWCTYSAGWWDRPMSSSACPHFGRWRIIS
jgi:hypothetical protein